VEKLNVFVHEVALKDLAELDAEHTKEVDGWIYDGGMTFQL
jgi:hypothetical protein